MEAVAYLIGELVLVAALILILFHVRGRFGLGLVYIFVASNQYLQTVLASTIYYEIPGGHWVSPGSIVLFGSSIFAVLLVYLVEDIPKTRTLIYGIVLANLTLAGLSWLTHIQTDALAARNLLGVPDALFQLDLRTFTAGSLTLLIDVFLVVVVYEWLYHHVPWLPLLGRVVLTMCGVLLFDALAFTTGAFAGTALFGPVLAGQLLAKGSAGVAFGLILYGYLRIGRPGRRRARLGDAGDRAVFEILTYRRQYEQAARELARVESESRAKSAFLTHMSHELRTPLNAILGFSKLLANNKKGHLSDRDVTLARRVRANGEHLLDLINDILDLSRIEAGQLELSPTEVDVGEVVREVGDMLEVEAERRGLSLTVECDRQPAPIRTDRGRLVQALINLVGNALKFTERGGVTIRVRCGEGDTRPIAIDVADTGVGMTDDVLARVFEPYRQAGPDEHRAQGTGLGLPITKGLVEALGYRLTATSQPGAGSTFTIAMTT